MQRIGYGIAALFSIVAASPALAANENVITQSKALAGNVTPGDTPGYPITINTPGAYVLGSGLDVTPGQWGIVVNANGVDIDMGGYTLSGNSNADYGVVSGYTDGSIHDGIIAAFKASGMYIRGNAWTIENMKILRNSAMGVDATGTSFLSVLSTLVISNGNFGGVRSGDGGIFRNNNISQNGSTGIRCDGNCHFEGNLISKNSYGILTVSGMAIGNTISRNTLGGIVDFSGTADTGVANNMLILNSPTETNQTGNVVEVHPNTCIGLPC